jgi:hypothetical protein
VKADGLRSRASLVTYMPHPLITERFKEGLSVHSGVWSPSLVCIETMPCPWSVVDVNREDTYLISCPFNYSSRLGMLFNRL